MKMTHMAAGILTGLLLVTGITSVSADSVVEPVVEKTFLYMNSNEVWLTSDVKAVNMKDGTLFLVDKTGERKMAIKNIDDEKAGVGFTIRELHVQAEDSIRFWEILADVGAHGKNCGYWLIAEESGSWRFVLMAEDLVSVGYRPLEWHLMSSEIENGRYILKSAIEYMPEGAQFQYERKLLTDWQAELVWSEKTRSFLLRPLPLG